MAENVNRERGNYRMIYSSYLLGQRINSVSPEAEAWFWRINVTCDDWGNRIAEPSLMRDVCGRRDYTLKQIDDLTRELEAAGLIVFYAVAGDRYLHVVDYEDWQPPDKKGRRVSRCSRYQDVAGDSGKFGVIPGSSGDSGGNVAHTPLMPKPMPTPIPKHIPMPRPKPTTGTMAGGAGSSVSPNGEGLRAGWGGLAGLERMIGAKLLEMLRWGDNEQLHPKTLVKLKNSPYCTGERVWWLTNRIKDGEADEPAKFLATAILDEWEVPSMASDEYESWREKNCAEALARAKEEDRKAAVPA
jgi:hypothetical protein